MERFAGDHELSQSERRAVINCTQALDKILQSYLHKMYSAGLLQHYGLPTELIDVTASLDVAASFATYKNYGCVGSIYVYDVSKLKEHAIVIDLERIHFARRPRQQKGYCLFHRTERNFKAKSILTSIGAKSHDFQGSDDDLKRYDNNNAIWGDANKDPVSGLLNKLLEDMVLTQVDLDP